MSGESVRLAPAPEPADIGIVAALPMEVAPLRSRLKHLRSYHLDRARVDEGELDGKLIALIVAGTGRKAAARGASRLIVGHRPRWLLSIGFAGALDPSLDRHTILLPSQCIDPEGHRLSIDLALEPTEGYRAGSLVTVDHIVRTASEKAELRRKTGADAVDMESSAVAALCAQQQVRFLSVRIISDRADEDLPPEVLTILGPTGSFRLGAAAGALWKRPGCVKDLWSLREHANEAARRLGAILPGMIARLF